MNFAQIMFTSLAIVWFTLAATHNLFTDKPMTERALLTEILALVLTCVFLAAAILATL